MTDKTDGVLAVMRSAVDELPDTHAAPLDEARAKVAELLAAAESLEHGVSAEKMIRLYDATLAMRGEK